MDTASAIERLAKYSKKNSRNSREIFEAGAVIFRDEALHRLGDDSARLSLSPNERHLPTLTPTPLHTHTASPLCAHLTTPFFQAGNFWNLWRLRLSMSGVSMLHK